MVCSGASCTGHMSLRKLFVDILLTDHKEEERGGEQRKWLRVRQGGADLSKNR